MFRNGLRGTPYPYDPVLGARDLPDFCGRFELRWAWWKVYNWVSFSRRNNQFHYKEAHVSVETQKQQYSGVRCYSCGEAIPVPTKTVQKVNARAEKADAGIPTEAPIVFNLRCKACEKESFYGVKDMVQMEGTPRLSRAGARANIKLLRPSSGLAHAANG
jgi:hypothetical protein